MTAKLPFIPAELRAAAERAVPFIEQVASQRAGGLPARARTLAFCGYQGTVAYSMLGAHTTAAAVVLVVMCMRWLCMAPSRDTVSIATSCMHSAGPGSHYCENIGRCHKSNFVFFVVNFSAGLFAQKCHDPNCCHYRCAPELLLTRFVLCYFG